MVRIPGSHTPNIKNRSSKHLIPFTKIKPAIWSMSGDQLRALSKNFNGKFNIYDAEIERRRKNREKRKTPRPLSKKNIES
jgi:hypothetical protein